MGSDPTIVARLDELLAAIGGYADPRRAADEWKQVYKLLQKTDVPPARFTGVVGMRNVPGLAELVDELREPGATAAVAATAAANAPDAETLKQALRAFRKRMDLTRLDEESKLGRGPLSKGSGHSAAAITTPTEFPEAVWQELARQGKLRYIGHGFYELGKE
jgi:hypothetical protein